MTGRLKLGQILVAKGLIHPDQLAAALGAQERGGGRLGATLVQMGAIDEEQLIRVLADQLGVQLARIGGKTVSAEVLALVPGPLAEKHRCLPLFLRDADADAGEELVLAMEDPSDEDALEHLRRHVACPLHPVLIAPSELAACLERYYPAGEDPEGTGQMRVAEPPAPPQAAAAGLSEPEPPEADLGIPPLAGLDEPSLADTAPDAEDPVLGDSRLGASAPGDSLLGDSLMNLGPAPFGDPGASWNSPADDPGLQGDSFVSEDPFAEFEKEPFADADAASVAEDPTDPVGASQPLAAPAAPRLEADVILQALAQILVEKGVITREEFTERLRSLARRPH